MYGLSVCTDYNQSLKLVAYRLVHTDEPYINLHLSFTNVPIKFEYQDFFFILLFVFFNLAFTFFSSYHSQKSCLVYCPMSDIKQVLNVRNQHYLSTKENISLSLNSKMKFYFAFRYSCSYHISASYNML